MSRSLLVVGSLLLSLSAHAAGGSAPSSTNDARSDELIHKGLALRRTGKGSEALEVFRQAHALAPSPRALGQLALAEASMQLWVDAETHLAAALALGADVWIRKNGALLDGALEVVRAHIGELAMTGPAGTDVIVDGRPVGTLPDVQPLHVAEGRALVTANGNGFKQFMKTVVIQAGGRTTLAILLEPVDMRTAVAVAPPTPALAPLSPTEPPPRRNRMTWAGGALATIGAGILTWGAIWIAAGDRASSDHPSCGPSCARVYDTRTAGWALAAGGAAAIVGGAALVIVGRHHQGPDMALGFAPSSFQLRARF